MTFLNALVADLKEKRLWPLGLGLVVALVAIPVLLAKPASESAPEAPAAPSGAAAGALPGGAEPVVSLAAPVGNLRRNLGRLDRKNPFVQQAQQKPQATEGLETPSTGATGTEDSSLTSTGGESGTTVPEVPGVGDGTQDTPSGGKLVYLTYTVRGSFGEIGKTRDIKLKTPRALPSESNPIAIFIGVERGAKAAVFAVGSGATAHGDGECEPSGSTCNFVRLKKGDVEFFEVPDGAGDSVTTYELDISRISLGVSNTPPSKAPSSDKKASAGGNSTASRKAADRRERWTLSKLGF